MTVNTIPAWPDAVTGGRYRLDVGRSAIAFRAHHLLGFAPVTGTMRIKEGDLSVDPVAQEIALRVVADAASFATGNDRRDRDLRSARFLHVTEFPQLVFQAGTLGHGRDGWALAGELTVRGVTRPLTSAIVTIESAARGFHARSHARVDRYALGVTAAKGLAGRYLDVDLTTAWDVS